MSIEVTNLTKSFGSQIAVQNLTFSIKRGEVVGFLGPNGAGKSTTMKMLTGYLRPDRGNIWICDFEISRQPLEAKKMLGYLPENNPLYRDMYVLEYLRFVAGLHKLPNRTNRIREVLEMTGLNPEKTKKINQLSKGFRQRLGLAQAIIHDPQVLILDEPISGLDPNQLEEIRSLIRALGKDKVVLFSSHILQEVAEVCDRIIILHHGVKVADEEIESLQLKFKTKRQIEVIFESEIPKKIIEELKSVESVVTHSGTRVIISFGDGLDPRADLFDLAVSRGTRISEMKALQHSLETVFQDLTKSG